MNATPTAKSTARLRFALTAIFRVSLAVAGVSLVYLLFVFGHTETAPLSRILVACTLVVVGALVAGILQWVGLPADPAQDPGKKRGPASSHK